MTIPKTLVVNLLSDTTVSAGRGAAGDVDIDVELELGCVPLLNGKSLHGLLRGVWLQMEPTFQELAHPAARLFGTTANFGVAACLQVADARVEPATRAWFEWARESGAASVSELRDALTSIRTQTAEDAATGGPKETSLRRSRAVVRGLALSAELTWRAQPTLDELRCLALSVLACRHIGLSRRRGRGVVRMELDGSRAATLKLAGLE